MLIHNRIRESAKTLNYLNIIEILIIIFFSWLCFDLLHFVMDQVTLGNEANVLGILATGVTVPIVGLIFGMLKSIGETYKEDNK